MNGTHLSEEQLVLCYYSLEQGEELEAARGHLAACADCREELASMSAALNVVDEWSVPERDDAYAARVWQGLELRMDRRPKRAASSWLDWFTWRTFAAAGAVACLVLVAFSLGRRFPQGPGAPPAEVAQSQGHSNERLLLMALNDHLEASQRMLTEVSNSGIEGLGPERESAEQLVAANRLYRQTARQTGDGGTAMLLEDLERYLLEAAHTSPQELKGLQHRMAEEDVLFRLRVLNSQLKQKQRKLLPVVSN